MGTENPRASLEGPSFVFVGLVFCSVMWAAAQQDPAAVHSNADRAAVPGLMQKGSWAEAQRIVETLLTADPDDAEARRWQSEITPIDTWEVVVTRGGRVGVADLWLRKKWLGFAPVLEGGQRGAEVQFPIEEVEVKRKDSTAWMQIGYGTVSHGLEIKVGSEKFRVDTRFPFMEVFSIVSRIRSVQVKSLRPEAPLPPSIESVLRGKDAARVKIVLHGAIQSGHWNDAEKALRQLVQLSSNDPDVKGLQDEVAIIRKWSVRASNPDNGAGTLYLRKHWITYDGEDYGDDRTKPQKNDSFHYPLTALKKISSCSEKEYGAKMGTGGLLDLVPGWASPVATGKNYGFEFAFDGGSKKYKLIVRSEGDWEDRVKADVLMIRSAAQARD